MKGQRVGLYLGVGSVGIAVVQGKNVVSVTNLEFSSLEEGKSNSLNEDIRWEALINKALREVGADVNQAYISLADRDFIFRPLEMPLMKKQEIESSLVYEIEKYIPFKLDELEWDYDFTRDSKEKKANVSFVGIREGNFRRVKDMLSRLGIDPIAIEPSCLSLARVLRTLKDYSKIENYALLDFTKTESYLTFFQSGLPVFNRYLTVPKKEEALDMGKFIESVNLSFQYFKREFKAYKVDKVIIVGNGESSKLVSALEEGLHAEAQIAAVSAYDLTANNNASVESTKALGAANRDFYPGFKPVLRKTEIGVEEVAAAAPVAVPALNIGMLATLLGIGIVALGTFFVISENDITEKKNNLKKMEDAIIVPPALKDYSWSQRAEMTKAKEVKVKALKEVVASIKKLSAFFNYLGRYQTLPEGIWLESMNISVRQDEYFGNLTGYVFRDDDYAERLGLDEFISILKADEVVRASFPNIELESSQRRKIREFEVTSFSIKLQ